MNRLKTTLTLGLLCAGLVAYVSEAAGTADLALTPEYVISTILTTRDEALRKDPTYQALNDEKRSLYRAYVFKHTDGAIGHFIANGIVEIDRTLAHHKDFTIAMGQSLMEGTLDDTYPQYLRDEDVNVVFEHERAVLACMNQKTGTTRPFFSGDGVLALEKACQTERYARMSTDAFKRFLDIKLTAETHYIENELARQAGKPEPHPAFRYSDNYRALMDVLKRHNEAIVATDGPFITKEIQRSRRNPQVGHFIRNALHKYLCSLALAHTKDPDEERLLKRCFLVLPYFNETVMTGIADLISPKAKPIE